MYVSSCQSVDMRIDIVKYEEHLFYCCQNYKKGGYLLLIFLQKLDRRLSQRLQLNIGSVIRVQPYLSGRSGKFEDFLEFSVLYVCPFQFVSDDCQVCLYSVLFCDLYWSLCSSNYFCDGHF